MRMDLSLTHVHSRMGSLSFGDHNTKNRLSIGSRIPTHGLCGLGGWRNKINPIYRKFIEERLEAGEKFKEIQKSLESVFTSIQEQCFFCEGGAEFYCDYVIGLVFDGMENGKRVGSFKTGVYTCDARICGNCRTKQPPIFLCGKNPEAYRDDYCRHHGNLLRPREEIKVLMPSEANQKRRHFLMKWLSRKTNFASV